MLDFFDERHWWNKPVPKPDKSLDWCPLHNYYYESAKGQTCLRCHGPTLNSKAKSEGGPST